MLRWFVLYCEFGCRVDDLFGLGSGFMFIFCSVIMGNLVYWKLLENGYIGFWNKIYFSEVGWYCWCINIDSIMGIER